MDIIERRLGNFTINKGDKGKISVFEATEEKKIIVVAPNKHRGIARKLVHQLSKLDKCNAVYWSIKQYTQNEVNINSKGNWVLTIGNKSENNLTKDYLSFIDLQHKDGGLFYGYDGKKALIFAQDIGRNKERFVSIVEENKLLNNNKELFTGPITGANPNLLALFLFVPFVKFGALPVFVAWELISKNNLNKIATAISADLFFINGDAKRWLEIHNKG